MKKACYFPVHESLNGNKIFEIANNLCKNGDWRLYYPHILKKKLADLKYDLSTPDINSPTKSEFTIYATIPKNLDQINKKKSILLLTETEAINKRDWDFKLHKYFNHIFTYKKLGDPKYIEFYDCPFNFEEVHFSKPINNKEILIENALIKMSLIPALRISLADTWLTVYRQPTCTAPRVITLGIGIRL